VHWSEIVDAAAAAARARSEAPVCCSEPRTPGGGTSPTFPWHRLQDEMGEKATVLYFTRVYWFPSWWKDSWIHLAIPITITSIIGSSADYFLDELGNCLVSKLLKNQGSPYLRDHVPGPEDQGCVEV